MRMGWNEQQWDEWVQKRENLNLDNVKLVIELVELREKKRAGTLVSHLSRIPNTDTDTHPKCLIGSFSMKSRVVNGRSWSRPWPWPWSWQRYRVYCLQGIGRGKVGLVAHTWNRKTSATDIPRKNPSFISEQHSIPSSPSGLIWRTMHPGPVANSMAAVECNGPNYVVLKTGGRAKGVTNNASKRMIIVRQNEKWALACLSHIMAVCWLSILNFVLMFASLYLGRLFNCTFLSAISICMRPSIRNIMFRLSIVTLGMINRATKRKHLIFIYAMLCYAGLVSYPSIACMHNMCRWMNHDRVALIRSTHLASTMVLVPTSTGQVLETLVHIPLGARPQNGWRQLDWHNKYNHGWEHSRLVMALISLSLSLSLSSPFILLLTAYSPSSLVFSRWSSWITTPFSWQEK